MNEGRDVLVVSVSVEEVSCHNACSIITLIISIHLHLHLHIHTFILCTLLQLTCITRAMFNTRPSVHPVWISMSSYLQPAKPYLHSTVCARLSVSTWYSTKWAKTKMCQQCQWMYAWYKWVQQKYIKFFESQSSQSYQYRTMLNTRSGIHQMWISLSSNLWQAWPLNMQSSMYTRLPVSTRYYTRWTPTEMHQQHQSMQ